MTSYVASPGGWLNTKSVRVAKALYVGTASALAILYVYGTLTATNITVKQTLTSQNITATGSVTAQTFSGKTLTFGGSKTITAATANGWLFGAVSTWTGSTFSGATLYGGGGLQLINGAGARFTTMEATTVSGATLRNTTGKFIVTNGTYPLLYLNGTATGDVLHAEKWLTSSGGLKVVGTSTLSTTNITAGNVQISQGYPGLKLLTTASGNVLHAEKSLTSSGTLNVVGTSTLTTVTATTVTTTSTLSGAKVAATPATGSAAVVMYGGAKGAHQCIKDTDGGGWTAIDALNGTVTAHIASAGECP